MKSKLKERVGKSTEIYVIEYEHFLNNVKGRISFVSYLSSEITTIMRFNVIS